MLLKLRTQSDKIKTECTGIRFFPRLFLIGEEGLFRCEEGNKCREDLETSRSLICKIDYDNCSNNAELKIH